MKKVVQFVLFGAVIAAAVYFAVSVFQSGLFERIKPTSFSTGDYDGYYFSKLGETEKKAYTAVAEKLTEFPESIETPKLDAAQLKNVLNAIVYDNPMMFMLRTCTLHTVGSKYYFIPDYTLTAQEYDAAQTKLSSVLSKIDKLTPDGSDYEKELFFHDYIINNCVYADTSAENESTVIGVFFDKSAKCSGYAKAFKLLLNRAGIDSVIVTGVAESFTDEPQNHMWNAVKLNSKWYFADVTWDDPLSDTDDEMCRHVFLNVNEKMLNATHSHYSVDVSCTNDEQFYYKVNNAWFTSFSDSEITAVSKIIAAAADKGEKSAEFMLSTRELTENAIEKLFKGQRIYRALEAADLASKKEIVTNKVKYSVDNDVNLVTVFFETKD